MPSQMLPGGQQSALLAAMADGIGELVAFSPEWVDAARGVLRAAVAKRAAALAGVRFTICEVAHNPPAWLHHNGPLAWHARFDGASVEVAAGELPASECDFRIEGDHSIMSQLARIKYAGTDPAVVAAAKARLMPLSRWKAKGALPPHKALGAVLAELHDELAGPTMARFVWMSPEWVSIARHLATTRAASEKAAKLGIHNDSYIFAEEFTHTPRYAFPDGASGGFWVHLDCGRVTVGSGTLPKEVGPADFLNQGMYTPVAPIGRDVTTALTDADKKEKDAYFKAAFRYDAKTYKETGKKIFPMPAPKNPSGRKGPMPKSLSWVMSVFHDELSKRSSGEMPSDYDPTVKAEWAKPLGFDRAASYDKSWLRYDKVDIYGKPLSKL